MALSSDDYWSGHVESALAVGSPASMPAWTPLRFTVGAGALGVNHLWLELIRRAMTGKISAGIASMAGKQLHVH